MSSIKYFKKFSENIIKADFHKIPTFELVYPKLLIHDKDFKFVFIV